MTDEKNLGSIKRETREAIGLSRKYLANIAGVSEATIMNFERGGRLQYESKSRLLKAYRTATRLYCRRNRMAYMAYIREYLKRNEIGIVEFSKMVKTGSDIYRDPVLKSFVLATADQIIKIEQATGIKYQEFLNSCNEESRSAAVDDVLQTVASLPSDILGKTEVTVDGATKHVECTTVGYSAECVGIDHVIYKKKIKRVTTEVIEMEIPADEFAKMMKGETA